MKRILGIVAFFLCACFASSLAAQDHDWYHERDERYRDEHWRGHIFQQVRWDLEHIDSSRWAAERERRRLERTKEELSDLQAKLEQGRFDRSELNDVIDSLTKSSNDTRLSPRDRDVLNDDTARLRDYREHHEHWNR
jgi:chromosome segregation ATPase